MRFGFFLPVWQRPQVAWAACLPAGLFGLSVGRRTLCLSLGGHFLSRWRTQGTKEINMNRELYENEDTLAQINVLFVKFFKNKLNCYFIYNYQDQRYTQCSCNFICLYIWLILQSFLHFIWYIPLLCIVTSVCVCHYLLIHQLFQRSFLCRTHLSHVNDSVFLPESRWLSLFMRTSWIRLESTHSSPRLVSLPDLAFFFYRFAHRIVKNNSGKKDIKRKERRSNQLVTMPVFCSLSLFSFSFFFFRFSLTYPTCKLK